MARIRTTKPEFWTSEQVVSCCRDARLLFIGMWNFCDDAGIHPKSYLRLKLEVFPADDCAEDCIKLWMDELIEVGLVREYSINGQSYWQVTGWKHQKIERPTFRFPAPSATVENNETSTNTRRSIDAQSVSIQRQFDDSSSTPHPRKGKEGKGQEEDIGEVSIETPPVIQQDNSSNTNTPELISDRKGQSHHSESSVQNNNQLKKSVENGNEKEILVIFEHWKSVMGHPRAKLDTKRHAKINSALKLGYTVEELMLAIDGCSKTPFNMGQNSHNKKYDSIDLIFRGSDKIESFIRNASENENDTTNLVVSQIDQISQGVI